MADGGWMQAAPAGDAVAEAAHAVETRGLTQRFGERAALDGVRGFRHGVASGRGLHPSAIRHRRSALHHSRSIGIASSTTGR